jgi:hypothetical protein
MAAPVVGNADTALRYLTFDLQFEPTELAADVREIREKGFGSIIWENHFTSAGSLPAETALIDCLHRWTAVTTAAGLACSLDLATLHPALFQHEELVAGLPAAAQYQAEIIEPAVQARLGLFWEKLTGLTGQVSGFLLPAFGRLTPPVCWYISPYITERFTATDRAPLGDLLAAFSTAAPDDQHRLLHRYRSLLSQELAQTMSALAATAAQSLGPACRLSIRPDTKLERVWPGLQPDQTIAMVFDEIGEIQHAEEIDRRPAAIISHLKMTVSRLAQAPARHQISLWGENFGGPRDNHALEVIGYWVDLLCTYNLAWQYGTFTRSPQLFSPAGRPGVAYPLHPSWKKFPYVNQKIALMAAVTQNARPCSPVAMVYPEETLERYPAEQRALLSRSLHTFIFNLVRAGYLFTIVPDAALGSGRVTAGTLELQGRQFTTILYPFPEYMEPTAWSNLTAFAQHQGRLVFIGMPPQRTITGQPLLQDFHSLVHAAVSAKFTQGLHLDTGTTAPHELADMGGVWKKPVWEIQGGHTIIKADTLSAGVSHEQVFYLGISPASLPRAALQELCKLTAVPRAVKYPSSAYLNLLADETGLVFTLCPCEFNGLINGDVEYGDLRFTVVECKDCLALRFNTQTSAVISHALFGEAEIHLEQ